MLSNDWFNFKSLTHRHRNNQVAVQGGDLEEGNLCDRMVFMQLQEKNSLRLDERYGRL